MGDLQKSLKEVNVLRDLAGHREANAHGFLVWTTFYGTVVEKIKDE